MGARQSKRSVDISGTPKKGDLENGTLTATTEEKLEKIGEGDVATTKVNANGSTTTTSTVTAEQQETAAAAATATNPPEAGDAPCTKSQVSAEEAEKPADVSTASVLSDDKQEPSSPASPDTTNPEESGAEKKKKPKKKWSFRSFSFSKKDKVKPATKDEKQETVPEGNENTQTEQVSSEAAANVSAVPSEEPPPLPTSPPPTPADETAETVEKEETPTISEGDVDASGGGEGLAEPIEEAELEESTTPAPAVTEVTTTPAEAPVAAVEPPLTNGVAEQNGDHKGQNGKFSEDDELISPVHERKPSVDSVTAKIGSLKLQIASENSAEPAQNGVSDETAPVELNGIKESDVPTTEIAAVEN